jgi:hypothetical protein
VRENDDATTQPNNNEPSWCEKCSPGSFSSGSFGLSKRTQHSYTRFFWSRERLRTGPLAQIYAALWRIYGRRTYISWYGMVWWYQPSVITPQYVLPIDRHFIFRRNNIAQKHNQPIIVENKVLNFSFFLLRDVLLLRFSAADMPSATVSNTRRN